MSLSSSSPNLLPAVELNPPSPPKASVIWLHGLGADGYDFVPIVEELELPADLPVRFIFPHAPEQAVTINGGYIMRAWYDIRHPDLQHGEDETGIRNSAAAVRDWIQQEIASGMPAERVFLAGFSQGGAIALFTALTYPLQLGGVIALSTYLPLGQQVTREHTQSVNLPIFCAHGTGDTIIPLAAGQASAEKLQELGQKVAFHSYPMAHSVCPQEIADIRNWLVQRLQES